MIFPFNAGEVFKIALNIEENGHLFYEQAAAKPFPAAIKDLFVNLGQEEVNHKKMFTALMEKLPKATTGATVWDPDNELDKYLKMMADTHVFMQKPGAFSNKLNQVNTPIEAVEMAMNFEKDTIIFFMELLTASDSSESRDQIQKLVIEEQQHLKALTLIRHQLLG